jgi:hypothetical protein
MNSKFTMTMKSVTIAALSAGLLWRFSMVPSTLLIWIVWAGTIVVFAQATRAGKYLWTGIFGVLVVLFNPVLPIPISASQALILNATTLILFMVSVESLREKPRLSIASITGRTPGGVAL